MIENIVALYRVTLAALACYFQCTVEAFGQKPISRATLARRKESALGLAAAGRRIGLLGGSFNPAHGGHLHISRLALARLGLDEVWWLVSPQNPLKPSAGMASLAKRLRQAETVAAADPRIRVSDIERRLGTAYTADTVLALRRRFPRARFVWLMGGDNLVQFPYWQRWQGIFRAVPIAVFARPGSSQRALAGMAAHRFADARLPVEAGRPLFSVDTNNMETADRMGFGSEWAMAFGLSLKLTTQQFAPRDGKPRDPVIAPPRAAEVVDMEKALAVPTSTDTPQPKAAQPQGEAVRA